MIITPNIMLNMYLYLNYILNNSVYINISVEFVNIILNIMINRYMLK